MSNELFVYRHKTDKDVYLIRKYGFYGSSDADNYYDVTSSFKEAIKNVVQDNNGEFESCLRLPYSYKGNYEADDTLTLRRTKKFEFDGYSGVLPKEFRYHLCDFEKVYFVEASTAKEGDSE